MKASRPVEGGMKTKLMSRQICPRRISAGLKSR